MKGKDSKTTYSTEDKKNKRTKVIIGIIIIIITIIILLLLTRKKYTISFNSNGGSLVYDIIVNKNSTILEPEKPTRENYVFSGWYYNDELYDFNTPVTNDIELEARWEKTGKVSGIKLDKEELRLSLGDTFKLMMTIEPGNAENKTVTWESSNPDIVSVDSKGNIKALKSGTATITVKTEDGAYTAKTKVVVKNLADIGTIVDKEDNTEKTNTCTVTFMNYDGSVLETAKVEKGTIPTYTKNIPTKTGNAQYTYKFIGWSPNVIAVEKDIAYTAVYEETINSYKVTFKDQDGKTLLNAQTIECGGKAEEPMPPTKEGHTFQGWYKGEEKYTFTEEVKANVILTAKWTKNTYTITFVNYDGTVLQTKLEEYGAIPTYTKIEPAKLEDEKYTYKFTGWSPNLIAVEKNTTYTATYTSTIKKYEVIFKDEDGTALSTTQTVDYGSKAEEPQKPIKEGYTFQGWYNGEEKYVFTEPVKGNLNLTAKWIKNVYTIMFVNDDGTVLETKTVEHGIVPEYTKMTPTKIADKVYTYIFKGWNKELVEATKNETYTATYTEKYIDYTIIFVNDDGTELSSKTYHYGEIVEQPQIPTKLADAQYTYTFAGWNPKVSTVEKDMTYIATYKETLNIYEVTFRDEDGTELLGAQTVKYGSKAIEPKEPTKEGHIFEGWYNGETKYTFTETVIGNVDLVARWTKIKYNITFVNYDGTVLETKQVDYGEIPTYTAETPTKTGDVQYSYVFAGWSPSITAVEIDITYTATYESTINSYKVTFKDEDGTELSSTQTVKYGNRATEPKTPIKKGYTFEGWYNGETKYTFTETITGNVELIAKWTKNKYTITFANYDGKELETITVEHGTKPTYTKVAPTKTADKVYTYTFKGWDKEVVEATKNETYTATYTEKYIDYTIIFVNEDGIELSNKTYHYGEQVEEPETPTKPADEQYTYTFKAWTPSITDVEKNTTYTATYTATKRSYKVTFKDEDGTELSSTQTVEYGLKAIEPTTPTKEGCTFQGWYNGVAKYMFTEIVTGNIELTAKWTKIKYNITFVNYDGTVLETKQIEYGTEPEYTKDVPTKPADAQYTYTFIGWNPSVTAAEKDTTYTATYESTTNSYKVTFKDEDGTELSSTQTVNYGKRATEPKTPIKRGYVFDGWYNGETKYTFTETVTGNVELIAKWTKNKYIITFVNYDGKELDTITVEHGTKPAYTKATPTKAADNVYTYTFKGWDKEVVEATKNETYTATYTATYIDYTIIFVNDDGTELSKKIYHYGEKVEEPETPTKPADEQYTYTFAGWSPSITTVEKNTTYTATYTATKRSYKVTFKDEDGTELSSTQTVEYGLKATEPTTPTKEGYIFQGWYNGETKYTFTEIVTGNVNLIAKWKKALYTITFVDYDGTTVLETKQVEHGTLPTYTDTTPTRPADSTLSYKFIGWSPSITVATEDMKYIAVYESFVDVDKKIEDAISGVNAKEFKVTKTENNINVKFVSYTENGVTVKPPYELIDLASGVVNLLNRLSSDPSYKSVVVNYKGRTLDAKKYEMNDAANWLAYLCGKSGMFGLLSATTNDLVGKTITITITLQDKYTLEDGGKAVTYNLMFS